MTLAPARSMIDMKNIDPLIPLAMSSPDANLTDDQRNMVGMLALTLKGAAEGWEPAVRWSISDILRAYHNHYGKPLAFQDLQRISEKLPIIWQALKFNPGYFYAQSGRELAVILLQHSLHPTCTVSEALRGFNAAD